MKEKTSIEAGSFVARFSCRLYSLLTQLYIFVCSQLLLLLDIIAFLLGLCFSDVGGASIGLMFSDNII